MRFMDMLRMSAGNLWKRKIRTFLTVLGVVIGTASIVVMISIGLGLNKATMEQMASYGSMTTIEVYSNRWENQDSNDPTAGYLSDETVEQFRSIEHVDYVSPVLSVNALGFSGKYQGWLNIYGMSLEAINAQGMEAAQGRLPSEEDTELTFFFGNNVLDNFYIAKSYTYYWEDPDSFDLDFMEDNLFVIFDQDAYYNYLYPSEGQTVAKPKKYIIPACGVERENSEEYQKYNYQVYCDIELLEDKLRQIFKNKAIPGQPTTKAGKPYKEFYYDNIYVNVDDTDHVMEVQEQITALGYQANSNMEWVEYSQKQYAMVQAVLGGIGAVALFVAAIGIANTMMMSIYERTKEIGIMKVLGCNMHNIQSMFLLEAAFIGFIGGIFGVGLSYGVSRLLNRVMMNSENGFMGMSGMALSYIPLWLVLVGIAFAVVVGTLAGFFPSLRAMRLSPLAAIRNE